VQGVDHGGTIRDSIVYENAYSDDGADQERHMATYTFSLSTSEDARQAGIIQSASFDEALRLVGERMTVSTGDTLEIGVRGFPPARYECVETTFDGTVFWGPAKPKMAA
jgi:hypothetical protein